MIALQKTNIAMENGPDVFPIEHGDVIPASYVIVYQRVDGEDLPGIISTVTHFLMLVSNLMAKMHGKFPRPSSHTS